MLFFLPQGIQLVSLAKFWIKNRSGNKKFEIDDIQDHNTREMINKQLQEKGKIIFIVNESVPLLTCWLFKCASVHELSCFNCVKMSVNHF